MAKSAKILLIDDEKIVRKTIKILLSRLDCEITEAGSAEDALEKLANTSFDVIILDILLPGMDGINLLRRAQADLINLPPVIVLTEQDTYRTAFDAGKLEVFGFMPKQGLDKEELKHLVLSALNKKDELSRIRVKMCFKHNRNGCNTVVNIPKNMVFIGIPFTMTRVYAEGIKSVVESTRFSLKCQRADEIRLLGDFSCKVCAIIQGCELAIFEISTLSANVILELGFAFSSGKDVLILKKKGVEVPSDLAGIELIEYTNIPSLRRQLNDYIGDHLKAKKLLMRFT